MQVRQVAQRNVVCSRHFPPATTAIAFFIGVCLFVPDKLWPANMSLMPGLAAGALGVLLAACFSHPVADA